MPTRRLLVAGLVSAFACAASVFVPSSVQNAPDLGQPSVPAPGFHSVAAHGHSVWHTPFELDSAGQKFFHGGDRTNLPALFASNPGWAVSFDMGAEVARTVRREVFRRVADGNAMVGRFHFTFPASGLALAAGHGYAFQPVA